MPLHLGVTFGLSSSRGTPRRALAFARDARCRVVQHRRLARRVSGIRRRVVRLGENRRRSRVRPQTNLVDCAEPRRFRHRWFPLADAIRHARSALSEQPDPDFAFAGQRGSRPWSQRLNGIRSLYAWIVQPDHAAVMITRAWRIFSNSAIYALHRLCRIALPARRRQRSTSTE